MPFSFKQQINRELLQVNNNVATREDYLSTSRVTQKYLRENDCIESFITFERETGVFLQTSSKEIEFFKKIILKGDFNEAINFILTFQNRLQEKDFRKIVLDVYKQKLLQLIENPNEEQLRKIFEKELINYTTEEEFQELFNYLPYRSVNQIQGYEKWSTLKGRYHCFENVIPYLEMFNSVIKQDEIEEKLDAIIDFYYNNKNNVKGNQSQISNQSKYDYLKQGFQKNKSGFNQSGKYQNSIQQQLEKKPSNVVSKQSNSPKYQKEKQLIKNSIMNLNISGNYSQIKNSIISHHNNQPNPIKSNTFNLEQNESKYEKNKQPSEKTLPMQKSQNISKIIPNNSSLISNERRPRVNASLNGPMNREREQGSIKLDNYVKNQQQQQQIPFNKSKLSQKSNQSQLFPAANSSVYSNKSFAKKEQNPSLLNNRDNPVIFNHINDLQSSQLNEISEEDHSESARSIKLQKLKQSRPNYIVNSRHKNEQDELSEQIRKNIEYLQQASSVIYKSKEDLEKQQFTFANQQKIRRIVKLAVVNDDKAIRTCQFSDSGSYFAVGTNSSILKIFDVQRLFEKNRFQQISPIYQIDGLHMKSIFCLYWSKNQRSLLTCSNDMNIKLTQLNKGLTEHKTSTIGKHDSCIRMIKYNASESRIFSCGDDAMIKVWDIGKVKKCINLKGHTSSVSAFKIHNENELYSVSRDMTIRRWDLRIGQCIFTSKPQESQLTYIASNTDKIVASHKDGRVSFFESGLQLEHSVQIHDEQIRSIEALKGEGVFLTASFDGTVGLFAQTSAFNPFYFEHNDSRQSGDKVVYATFLHSPHIKGFASTSTQGLCHIYSYE